MPALGLGNPLIIEPLNSKRHDRVGFSCGVPILDTYLHRQAAQDMEKRAAVVYVAVIEAPAIAGFYTLSQFSIELKQLPEIVAKRLPSYPVVPASMLGRLAVARSLHRHKLGETLLFDALRRSLAQSAHIASAGVIVDAKDEKAAAFYLKFGFLPVRGFDRRLFLHMKSIERMF